MITHPRSSRDSHVNNINKAFITDTIREAAAAVWLEGDNTSFTGFGEYYLSCVSSMNTTA